MMIKLLGDERGAGHETERLVEVAEHEFPRDRIAPRDVAPAGQSCESARALSGGEFLGHSRKTSWSGQRDYSACRATVRLPEHVPATRVWQAASVRCHDHSQIGPG